MGGFNSLLLGAIFHSICFRYLAIYIEDDISAWAEIWAMTCLTILTATAPAGPMAARSGILSGGDDDVQFLRPGAQIATQNELSGLCIAHIRLVRHGRCVPLQIIAQGCLLWLNGVTFLLWPAIGDCSYQSNDCQQPSKSLHHSYCP